MVVNREGDENERRSGLGSYFHARPQQDTTEGDVKPALVGVCKLSSAKLASNTKTNPYNLTSTMPTAMSTIQLTILDDNC